MKCFCMICQYFCDDYDEMNRHIETHSPELREGYQQFITNEQELNAYCKSLAKEFWDKMHLGEEDK